MKSQVAGKGAPGSARGRDDADGEPLVESVNQPDGTGSGPPRSVRGPVTPPLVTEYLGWTVAASGSTVR